MPYMFYGPTRWVGGIVTGSLCLVAGVVLWLFPDPSTNSLCTPGFVILGIVFLAGGLLTGHQKKWKIR